MKPLILASIILLAASGALFGTTVTGDLTFLLDPPATEIYPPGTDTATCQSNNDPSGACVQFTGTLLDNDIDGSIINLDGITVSFLIPADASYFSLPEFPGDSTFDGIPQTYIGDPTSTFLPYTYSGPIFGLGILNPAATPDGVYQGTATISYDGGTAMATTAQTLAVPFTIIITPEPAGGLMTIAGLIFIAAIVTRRRHRKPC